MSVSLFVISAGKRISVPPLGDGDPPIIPAQNVILELEGDGVRSEVLLDDDWVPLVRNEQERRGYALVDCFRSTGFHRVLVDDKVFCFGTADAKLELDGILSILDFIGEEGLSWGHQLVFSNGNAIRDPRVDYAWLRKVGRTILKNCQAIAARPAAKVIKLPKPVAPRGGRVVVGSTMALLRSDPRRFLEEHDAGLIEARGRRWMPRRVVAPTRDNSEDIVGNRRATRLLTDTNDLIASLCAQHGSELPKRQRQWLTALRNEIELILEESPFRDLKRYSGPLPDAPSREELDDPRYEAVFDLFCELTYDRAWQPGKEVSDRNAFVGYSDQIYQAFVAVLLGDAFEAAPVGPYLCSGLDTPSFRSDKWDVYYDTAPPKPEYRSWRDYSSRPARLTPDYCIVDRISKRGILADAKYRGNKSGRRLPSSALGDCQVYMQHFGCNAIAVFYPGPDFLVEEISGEGNSILEVSVTPVEGVREWMRDQVRPKIEELLQPLHE